MNINYTLDQLMALEAIHRVGSFAGAAQSLNRATSAISYSIKTLETGLGVKLFDRSGHKAVLTAAGRLILLESRRVIREARRLEQVGRELNSGYEPELTVVMDGIVPLAPMMDAMRIFSGQERPTRLKLVVDYLKGVNQRFQNDSAAMMVLLNFEGDERLSAIPLPPVCMYLVSHRDHALQQGCEPLNRRVLAEHVEWTVADPAGTTTGPVHRLFLGSTQLFQMSDFHSKVEALRRGVGYGWLPGHLAEPHLASGELAEINFEEGSRHTFEPHLVYRTEPPMGLAGREFIDIYLDQVDAAEEQRTEQVQLMTVAS